MKRIVVHIDRLVLKGIRPQDRHAFAAGLRQEMERQFAEPQLGPRLLALGDRPRLQIGAVHGGAAPTPAALGERVAQGIGKGAME